jgi:hypothetical protein
MVITAPLEPDCAVLHIELRRVGVTLALLHVEYGIYPASANSCRNVHLILSQLALRPPAYGEPFFLL